MATTLGTTVETLAGRADGRAAAGRGPARAAAAQVARAGMALGALGLAASMFEIVRLFETWQIGSRAHAREVVLLGLRMAYPVANAEAFVILALAFLGFAVTAMAVAGALQELVRARRFGRRLASTEPERLGDAFVVEDEEPRAFCAGLLRPRVYISTVAIALLDPTALEAVLVHERHHARRRDPLRLATGRVVARSLFFLPWLGALQRHERTLSELGADECAVTAAPQNRRALARAMLRFSDEGAGIDPARVDHLLGEAPRWRFPALLCIASLLTITLLVAVAILAGELAAGTATFAPPVLSRQPCVVTLAVIPVSCAVLAAATPRSRRRRADS